MTDNSIVGKKSYAFALKIVDVYKDLKDKNEFAFANQILRSGTSIGANVAEGNGGISDSDFSAKMSIAYKEGLETKYWLNLLKDKGYLSEEKFTDLHTDADELCKMLFSIVKRMRIKPVNSEQEVQKV